jgi:hypothetical protein
MKRYVALLLVAAASVAIAAGSAPGYVSVYISDNRAIGMSISPNNQREADDIASTSCAEYATDDDKETCVKAIEGVAKCVAVARSEEGAWGAAMGETTKKASDLAVKTCNKYAKSKCTVDKAAKLCI